MNTTITTNVLNTKALGEIKMRLDQLKEVKSFATDGSVHFTLVQVINTVMDGQDQSYEYGSRMVVSTKDSSFNDNITDWEDTNLLLGDSKIGQQSDEIKSFSSKIFMLELDEALATLLADTKDGIFYNMFDGTIKLKDLNGYYDLITHRKVSKLSKGYERYTGLAYTTGSTKKSQMLFVKADSGETWCSFIEKVLPGFTKSLEGASSIVKTSGGKFTPGKKASNTVTAVRKIGRGELVKIFGRISLAYTSGGRVTDNLGAVAYYHGTFDEVSGMSDGMAFVRESYAEGLFALIEGEAIGLQFQPRVRRGIIKSMCIILDDAAFDEKVLDLKSTGELELLGNGQINMIADNNNVKLNIESENDMKVLAIGSATSGQASKQFWQKVLFSAAKKGRLGETIEYITGKGKKEIEALIEGIFSREGKAAKLGSKYIMDLLAQEDPDNVTLLHSIKSDTTNAVTKLINKLALKLNFEDGTASIWNGVVTPDICTAITGTETILGKTVNGKHEIFFGKFSKKIGKKRRTIARINNAILTKKLSDEKIEQYKERVAELETQVAELRAKFVENGVKILKYPTVFIEEFLDAYLVDSYELELRVLANPNIKDVYKASIIRLLYEGSDSMLMFASDSSIYDLLAGMDNDYDKAIVVFDKFINDIMDGNEKAEITLIQQSASNGEEFVITDKALPMKLFAAQIDPKNSVGGVTVQADRFNLIQSGLYASRSIENMLAVTKEADRDNDFYTNIKFLDGIKACSYEAALTVLRESVGETDGENRAYTVQLSDHFDDNGNLIKAVDDAFSFRMAKEIREVEWSEENIRAFLLDVSKIYRLYQEGIIDSAKTGIHVNRIFTAKAIILMSNIDLYVSKNEDGDVKLVRGNYYLKAGDIVKVKNDNGEVEREVEAIEYHDILSLIQDQLAEYFNVAIKEAIESHSSEFKYDDADIAAFRKAMMTAEIMNKDIVMELYNCKIVYHSLSAMKVQAIADASKTLGDDADQAIEAITEQYNRTFAALATTVEDYLSQLKLKDGAKGALVLGIGCFNRSKNKFNAAGTSKFAYLIASKYAYKYLLGSNVVGTYAKLVVDNDELADGTKLQFTRGIDATNKVVIKDKYTGTAVYHIGDDYNYVQVDVKIDEMEMSDERVIVVTGSPEYLLDKFNMVDTGKNNTFVFQGGKLQTENDEQGWDVVNANGKSAYVNTMKERVYYKATSSNCVYTKYDSSESKLTYLVLTVKED